MIWNRRSVLRALATSATAPLVVPFIQACGASDQGRKLGATLRQLAPEPIRGVLREVVPALSQRFPRATGFATLRRIDRAMADAEERGVNHELQASLVLEVEHQDRRFEQVTTDLSPAGIRAAAKALRGRAAASYQPVRPVRRLARSRDFASDMNLDPREVSTRDFIRRLEDSYQASRTVGGSRIVYRGAYLIVDDRIDVFVGQGRDLSQRLVRTRSGVVLVAQRRVRSSPVPMVDSAERSGLMGLEATSLSRRSLEGAADRVLAMVSPTAYPTGTMTVVLAPTVTALLTRACVAPALAGHRWLVGESRAVRYHEGRIASERMTLIDDPSVAGAYGSYFFDDEGQLARPAVIIDGGVLTGPLTDRISARLLGVPRTANGRRADPRAPVRACISNLSWAPGSASREQLLSGVERGLLLDGGLIARSDPRTWRYTLRAARGYEIRAGKTTGVLYSDVDVRGYVPDLLGAVEGVSATAVRTPTGAELPATTGSPYLLTRAEVV